MKRDRRIYDLLQNVARNLTALSAAISEIVDLETRKDKKHEESSTSEVEEDREEEKPKKRQRSEKDENFENDIAGIFDKEDLDAIESALHDQEWNHFDDFFSHVYTNKIIKSAHSKDRVRRVCQVFYGVWDYERTQKKKKQQQKQNKPSSQDKEKIKQHRQQQGQTPKQKNKPNGQAQ